MRQIGTYRKKVGSGTDSKKLADGSVKKYTYGMVVVRTPKLSSIIGKKVMIRIFEETKKKAKV